MKKYLSILTFLILFLPMWQACEKKIAVPVDALNAEILIEKAKQQNTGFLSIFDSENSVSGYELTWFPVKILKGLYTEGAKELNFKAEIINILNWILCLFFSYTLISLALVILAFIKKKEKLFFRLSAINLCVIIISYFSFLYISSDIFQIKYGFYLLIMNSALIFYSNFKYIKK